MIEKMMQYRDKLTNTKLLVVKIGTSSLTFHTQRLNFQWMTRLVAVLSAVRQEGLQLILVSSGAVGVGAGRLGFDSRPVKLEDKQALAAIGQAELIRIYERFFFEYQQSVAQVLLTRDGLEDPVRRANAKTTLSALLEMNVIPVINENDTVSTKEMEFGDNDTLSAKLAELVQADLLILLSDIEGLYTGDPRKDPGASLITSVSAVTDEMMASAGGSGSTFGIGGMVTKLGAARICQQAGIDMVIASGKDPEVIREILSGKEIGTHFIAP